SRSAPPISPDRAQVAELVDALVSGTSGESRGGSSPLLGTSGPPDPLLTAMDISLALLTHNETTEFTWLMEALLPARDVIGEMVVVDDFSGPAFAQALERFRDSLPLRVFRRRLDNDFAAQRNFMKAQCRGRLIFFLDPDELPPLGLVRGLPRILEMME